jgi:hypothetical protein
MKGTTALTRRCGEDLLLQERRSHSLGIVYAAGKQHEQTPDTYLKHRFHTGSAQRQKPPPTCGVNRGMASANGGSGELGHMVKLLIVFITMFESPFRL